MFSNRFPFGNIFRFDSSVGKLDFQISILFSFQRRIWKTLPKITQKYPYQNLISHRSQSDNNSPADKQTDKQSRSLKVNFKELDVNKKKWKKDKKE